MSEDGQSPRSSVFTTMRFSKVNGVFLLSHHIARLKEHATKLRIDHSLINERSILEHLELNSPELNEGLVRVNVSDSSDITITYRPFSIQNECIDAITHPSPRWPKRIAGTKHGAWSAYIEARKEAEWKGADVALLVHEYSIIDGDRCSPVVLDEDGVVWLSDSPLAVDSITIELIRPFLVASGYHIQTGQLNERLVARCAELVAVGTGVGVVGIESIDGEPVGDDRLRLFEACTSALQQLYDNTENWTEVW